MATRIKRVYVQAGEQDGTRILVDRIWPRGVRKAEAGIDLWLKEIAPSSKLRQWFSHDPEKWPEFKKSYFCELDRNEAMVEKLSKIIQEGTVTLVFGARNEKYNNAVALKEYLEQKAGREMQEGGKVGGCARIEVEKRRTGETGKGITDRRGEGSRSY